MNVQPEQIKVVLFHISTLMNTFTKRFNMQVILYQCDQTGVNVGGCQ